MLRSFLITVVSAAASVAVGAAPAHAVAFHMAASEIGTSGIAGDPGLRTNEHLVTSFDGGDSLTYDAAHASGFGLFTNSQANVAAAPAGDTSQYMAVGTGGSVLFDLRGITDAANPLASVSAYVGSIDIYNFVDILGLDSAGGLDYDHPLLTVGGAALMNGTFGHPDGRLTFGFGADDHIGGIVFRSTGVAFEFDSLAISTMRAAGPPLDSAAPVPEAASWAMMLGGFGMIGGVMRSRNKRVVSFG